MADNISTLLGMGLSPQDDMTALANSLRGEQGMGDYYSMSTLAPIAQLGKTMQGRSTDAANRGGVLSQAIAKEATREAELAAANKQAQENYKATALAKTMAAKQLASNQSGAAKLLADEKANKRTNKVFWHPTKPNETIMLNLSPDGNWEDPNTDEAYMARDLRPYNTGSEANKQGKLSAKEKANIVQEKEEVRNKDFVSSRMSSPHLAGSTGSTAAIGTYLPELVGINPKAGSLRTDLSGMTVQQASEPLSYLGVNPTDKDLAFALQASRTLGSQPESWRDWYRDIYAPEIERLIAQYADESGYNAEEKIAEWRGTSQSTLEEMNKNIELESGKGMGQRFSETMDESKTEEYKARQTVPEGVNPEHWADLTDEEKTKWLKL